MFTPQELQWILNIISSEAQAVFHLQNKIAGLLEPKEEVKEDKK